MFYRCYDPRSIGFEHWGGRGITVCPQWRSFDTFLNDMGPVPGIGWSIERIDVNGNYAPGNCKWIPKREQPRNRRNTRRYTFQGETLTLWEWSDKLGIPHKTLNRRFGDGWDADRALTTPMRRWVTGGSGAGAKSWGN